MEILSPLEYEGCSFYDQQQARAYQIKMVQEGWDMYDINSNRTGHFFMSVAYKRRIPRDEHGFTSPSRDFPYRDDEIAALRYSVKISDGVINPISIEVYTQCAAILVNRGWINDDLTITEEGRAALKSVTEKETCDGA